MPICFLLNYDHRMHSSNIGYATLWVEEQCTENLNKRCGMPLYSLPSENFIHCLVVFLSLIVVKIPRANCDPISCLLQRLLLSKSTRIKKKNSINSNMRMKKNVGHSFWVLGGNEKFFKALHFEFMDYVNHLYLPRCW